MSETTEDPKSVSKHKPKYPKNSMDRLGDDLTELVLSYLSFDHSVRFECVSKQWRRVIYNKQMKLIIDGQFIQKQKLGHRLFRVNAVESVLNKCPNITTIVIQRGRHKSANLDQVFELIIKHCDRLFGFTVVSKSEFLSDELTQRFFEKFGPKLKTITVFNPRENLTRFKTILRLCPRLEAIESHTMRLSDIFDGNEVLVKSLLTFGYRFSLDDTDRLKLFVDNNKNSLESLSLDMSEHLADDNDFLLYDQLVRLTRLRRLRLTYEGLHKSAHHVNFVRFVSQLAENCPKLYKLDIELYGEDYRIVRPTYQALNGFTNVKHLRFHCSDIQKSPEDGKIAPLEALELQHLAHLEMMCSFAPITDTFFAQMARNMPRLQTIHCENLDITDNALKSLLTLHDLKEISLDWNRLKVKFSDDLVLNIIKKYRNLKLFVAINTGVKTRLTEADLYRFRVIVPIEEWTELLHQFIVSRHVDLTR